VLQDEFLLSLKHRYDRVCHKLHLADCVVICESIKGLQLVFKLNRSSFTCHLFPHCNNSSSKDIRGKARVEYSVIYMCLVVAPKAKKLQKKLAGTPSYCLRCILIKKHRQRQESPESNFRLKENTIKTH
jgi:hypothetical protein